jgi:hypothetical protein
MWYRESWSVPLAAFLNEKKRKNILYEDTTGLIVLL